MGSDAPREEVSTAGPYRDTSSEPPADAGPGTVEPGDTGAALLADLDRDFSPDRTLGYDAARDALYAYEQRTHGRLCGVYEAFCVTLSGGDPSSEAYALGINAEHTWPQSMGARAEPLRSDLHHLFPTRETVNAARGNLPLGEVPDDRAQAWYRDSRSQSTRPADDRGDWAERGAGRFEPPDAHKGNAGRAIFYVVATYPDAIDAGYFATMRTDLLAWNRLDPPDAAERARSTWIARLQGTENPFVLDPTLADRAFGTGVLPPPPASGSGTSTAGPVAPPPAAPSSSGDLWISEIHYDNAGDDVGEGVEVSGPPGTALDGWRIVLASGSTGLSYGTLPLSGTLPASGALWIDAPGLQNGAPDGLALVSPDGSCVEGLAYEGAFTMADGPGCVLRDIGVSEGANTAPGQSLSRPDRSSDWRAGPATPGRR